MKILISICYLITLFASMGFILNSFIKTNGALESYIIMIVVGIAVCVIGILVINFVEGEPRH